MAGQAHAGLPFSWARDSLRSSHLAELLEEYDSRLSADPGLMTRPLLSAVCLGTGHLTSPGLNVPICNPGKELTPLITRGHWETQGGPRCRYVSRSCDETAAS